MKTPAILMATALIANSLSANSSTYSLNPITHEAKLEEPHHYQEIQTEVLSRLVRSANPSLMIVDVRDIKTDDGKRIPSAKPIPFDSTTEHITANLPDKQAMIIVYCSNARCPQNKLFADRLIRMGFKNVWIYSGGIEEWEKSGQKVEKGKTAAEAASELGPKAA